MLNHSLNISLLPPLKLFLVVEAVCPVKDCDKRHCLIFVLETKHVLNNIVPGIIDMIKCKLNFQEPYTDL